MNICVFCSSSNAIHDDYFHEARVLGKLIGENNYNLINGGSNVGLMEATAQAARKAGAHVKGIIPQKIHDHNLGSKTAHKLIVTENMRDRKYLLRKYSDAFIALPGGFGTLEEILEVITLKQLCYHNKPIVFINTRNFYTPLFSQFKKSFEEIFAKSEYRKLYAITDNATEAIAYIKNYNPDAHPESKWFNVPQK